MSTTMDSCETCRGKLKKMGNLSYLEFSEVKPAISCFLNFSFQRNLNLPSEPNSLELCNANLSTTTTTVQTNPRWL